MIWSGGTSKSTMRARFIPSQLLVVEVPKSTASFTDHTATVSRGTRATATTVRQCRRAHTTQADPTTTSHSTW